MINACPQALGLLPLRQAASALAAQRRRQAAMAVASVRYARLMLGLVDWLQASAWQASLVDAARTALGCPLPKRAGQILLRCHATLQKRGKRLVHGTAEQRHRLRIAARKARYATEFFLSLHSAPRAKRCIKRLAGLLDTLGGLNDAAVADRLLCEIEDLHPDLAASTHFARGYLCATTTHSLPGLARLWRSLRSIKPP